MYGITDSVYIYRKTSNNSALLFSKMIIYFKETSLQNTSITHCLLFYNDTLISVNP